MKQLFLCLIGIPIIMSSCSKTDPVTDSTISGGTNPPPLPQAYTLNLNAIHWINNQDGTYTCTFKNILNYSSYDFITVFLKYDDHDTEISNGGMSFMGGELKYKIVNKDLLLVYDLVDGTRELPFSSLNIKVVFQH